jgi:hypothetical protein
MTSSIEVTEVHASTYNKNMWCGTAQSKRRLYAWTLIDGRVRVMSGPIGANCAVMRQGVPRNLRAAVQTAIRHARSASA